jgi:rhodanese-related sulfurtransferase
MTLPDSSLVYPAHGAGSLCGKALSKETVSTIGEQRRVNYALQPMSKAAFVDLVTADQPDAPPYFTYDAVLNTKERPTLASAIERELAPLTVDSVLALQEVGAQVLDTRDAGEFATAHLRGSINVGLDGQFATWAGTVLSREHPIVVVAAPGRERESMVRLGRIGFDHVVGYLQDGMLSLRTTPGLTTGTERLSAPFAAERIASNEPPQLVDVRSAREYESKHITGGLLVPLTQLTERLADLDPLRPVLVHCAGGYRSSVAASLLQRHGFANVSEIAGGLAAWEAAGLPVETP